MTNAATNPPIRPAARLAGVCAYAPPAPRWAIDLRLDANECATPDGAVLDAVRSADPELVRRYPGAGALEAEIGDSFGVHASRVIVTAGGDDAIDRVARAFLEPGRVLVTHAPSFVMIPRSARLAGADVLAVEWIDGAFPEDDLVGQITPEVGVVALVTPNNPTGAVIPCEAVARIADAARAVGAVVLLDLAYTEFADTDPTPMVLVRDNVVVVRTFSKAMGLAGLRVGYAIAPAEIAPLIRAAGGPYPVSGVSLAAAACAWSRRDDAPHIDAVRSERGRLFDLCERLGLEPIRSGANFVTIRSARAAWIYEALGSLGIAVRLLPDGVGGELCRITLPACASEFGRLTETIEVAADPEAILFDLDGVLADVSDSYRAAIIETAEALGASVTRADIAEAKARGDANNDWALTRRLLAERGVDVSIERVTEVFQRVYLGDETKPGLRERERLIVTPGFVESMRARLPIAIVTGRPRDEAEWFLKRAGIRTCFDAVIAMEDAPAKPSPEPVALALGALGVTRAWMIGDTPDDAVAARAAGVVPIGIGAPGDPASSDVLTRAGVARVLDHLTELEELLP